MPFVESGDLRIDQDLPEQIRSPEYGAAKRPPLVVILGPTAVGKTEAAIQLAERMDGEIVSADSRLLYRGMDIGTAKPSPEQRKRVPHYLIDITDPDQVWSLTLFQRAAHEAINGIHSRGRMPFLVGGTGQYVRAILESWQIPEIKPDPQIRTSLETWAAEIGADGLHDRLAVLDPEAAAKIDYRNLRRTIRALEVILLSGEKFSSQRRQSQPPYRAMQIGLSMPRADLYALIDSRIDAMLDAGLVEETMALLERGYAPDLPTFSAIGYREIIDHLLGETTLEEAVMLIKRHTRQLVRRQANWFKEDDPDIHWFEVRNKFIVDVEALLRNWLESD
jgi:tRNA dimethylallyltransferase